MTGRVRVFASLLIVAMVAAALLSAILVAAPPPIPMRVQGQAFDRAGTALPVATPIRAFVDGVDYSNDPQVGQFERQRERLRHADGPGRRKPGGSCDLRGGRFHDGDGRLPRDRSVVSRYHPHD